LLFFSVFFIFFHALFIVVDRHGKSIACVNERSSGVLWQDIYGPSLVRATLADINSFHFVCNFSNICFGNAFSHPKQMPTNVEDCAQGPARYLSRSQSQTQSKSKTSFQSKPPLSERFANQLSFHYQIVDIYAAGSAIGST